MEMLSTPDFWIGLVKIIWINTILSGDNAVVIALAARTLQPQHQKLAVIWGSAAAVVLLVLFTVGAAKLMELPYVELVGGILLLWIGAKLLGEEDEAEAAPGDARHHGTLMSAIRTILIADLIMSLDNVIAVAAAAQGSLTLLIMGLGISIPVVIFGATLMVKVMERFPILAVAGACLIGWVAGETIVSDEAVAHVVSHARWVHYTFAAIGAVTVFLMGKLMQSRADKQPA